MTKLKNIFYIILPAVIGLVDGHFYAWHDDCITNYEDGRDMVYTRTFIFDQLKITQFNSTVGKFVGYTEYGVKNAESRNNDTEYLQRIKDSVDSYCRFNMKIYYETIFNKAVAPEIDITLVKEAEGSHPAMLMCSAYNFYPPAIEVTWLKNGAVIKGGITSKEEMPNGDWYYQVHSHLMYTPQSGEEISCVVQHASSTKPYIYKWDNSGFKDDQSKIAIGVSGLVLGIILLVAGLIYYKKKSCG